MLPITHLTIHCAATPEGRAVKAAEVEKWDIARFNQKSYHWIVELDGNPHRSLDDNVRGAHTGGHNTGNIGICYVGGCDIRMHAKDTRTPQQRASLEKLIKDYKRKYPGIVILGHRDWPDVHKDCPSFSVAQFLKEIGA
jgi:N-acetylmuramoyl-L-alanine amidase